MKKIKDTVDNQGNVVELWYSESISYTPVLPLFLKTYAELIENNLTLPVFGFKNTNTVTWAQDSQGNVLGGICYEYVPETKIGWLVLSFTAPEFRGRGINQLCHEIYEKDCKNHGATSLGSMVSTNNESRLKSAKKVGMLPTFYRLHKKI